jgi:hypothetical protein
MTKEEIMQLRKVQQERNEVCANLDAWLIPRADPSWL